MQMQMQGGATTGKLRLEVIEARLTRDTEAFGKMDPYVKIQMREQLFKTKTMQEAGKTPKWNQVKSFNLTGLVIRSGCQVHR